MGAGTAGRSAVVTRSATDVSGDDAGSWPNSARTEKALPFLLEISGDPVLTLPLDQIAVSH